MVFHSFYRIFYLRLLFLVDFLGDFLTALGREGLSVDEFSSGIAPGFSFFESCLFGLIFSSEFAELFEVEGLGSSDDFSMLLFADFLGNFLTPFGGEGLFLDEFSSGIGPGFTLFEAGLLELIFSSEFAVLLFEVEGLGSSDDFSMLLFANFLGDFLTAFGGEGLSSDEFSSGFDLGL